MKKILVSALIGVQAMMMFSAGASAASVLKINKGDTLLKISEQCRIDLQDILKENWWILNPDCIIPGQIIVIPGGNAQCPEQEAPLPDEDVTIPEGDVTVPDEDVTIPEGDMTVPDEDVTIPEGDMTVPDEDVIIPGGDTTVPDDDIEVPEGETGAHRFESEVVKLVNEIRAKNDLNELIHDEDLSEVARIKSQDMKDKNYFSHTSPTYGSPFDMMKAFGISFRTAAENIAMGQKSPEAVVNAWMNSEGHRKNILNASYTHIGVGYVTDGNYWTQMFVGR